MELSGLKLQDTYVLPRMAIVHMLHGLASRQQSYTDAFEGALVTPRLRGNAPQLALDVANLLFDVFDCGFVPLD